MAAAKTGRRDGRASGRRFVQPISELKLRRIGARLSQKARNLGDFVKMRVARVTQTQRMYRPNAAAPTG